VEVKFEASLNLSPGQAAGARTMQTLIESAHRDELPRRVSGNSGLTEDAMLLLWRFLCPNTSSLSRRVCDYPRAQAASRAKLKGSKATSSGGAH